MPHGWITGMESLVDAQLTLINKEATSIRQSYMELVVRSGTHDHCRPPTPPVPDLNEVKLFKLHQNSWWDRLQKGMACLNGQWSTNLAIVESGHPHLILVIPNSRDNPAIDAT
ncbi:hypothetical protein L2E82_07604 [Cichorium intybus]|uniref:Uncharacterized protein n=1 Tax=Cichorium intybus TaxID=13427 RepID=A0ACB9G4A2_CICIN|nr:hypothetical protein L2E82_07604 [Cichorium intybus]